MLLRRVVDGETSQIRSLSTLCTTLWRHRTQAHNSTIHKLLRLSQLLTSHQSATVRLLLSDWRQRQLVWSNSLLKLPAAVGELHCVESYGHVAQATQQMEQMRLVFDSIQADRLDMAQQLSQALQTQLIINAEISNLEAQSHTTRAQVP